MPPETDPQQLAMEATLRTAQADIQRRVENSLTEWKYNPLQGLERLPLKAKEIILDKWLQDQIKKDPLSEDKLRSYREMLLEESGV
jgi:hypothetical protein